SQLSVVLYRPDRVADWHLDDAHRHQLAGVPADQVGVPAWCGGIFGTNSDIPAGAFAGVWVDRWNRHRVLVLTQTLSMVQSFLLAALALSHRITVTDIILLSLFQGAINAFDMPARQAFVIQMVESREDLPNAIALNSSMVNASRLIGPSIAGAVIAMSNEGYCFLIDGVSYIAVIASLLAMKMVVKQKFEVRRRVLQELAEGCRYVSGFVPIRSILLRLALVSLVGMPYTDVLQLSELLAGYVKESGNDSSTRDLQMAADRTRPHTLCSPAVSSLFSFTTRCSGAAGGAWSRRRPHNGLAL